jgi:hypothetical protein
VGLRNGQTGQREPKENQVTQTIEEKNKAFVLEAFDTLFNKRDYAAAERFWSPNYIQHSAHIRRGHGNVSDNPNTQFHFLAFSDRIHAIASASLSLSNDAASGQRSWLRFCRGV